MSESNDSVGRWQASIGDDGQRAFHDASSGSASPRPAGLAAITGTIEMRKKAILLVDSNLRSRESRAKLMRTRGVHVDCVADAAAARVRLAAEKYNLVLIDLGKDVDAAEALFRDIKSENSRQLVGFLVGSPLFIASSLSGTAARPRRTAAPTVIVPEEKPIAPAAAFDFGQKIKDAEAEGIA